MISTMKKIIIYILLIAPSLVVGFLIGSWMSRDNIKTGLALTTGAFLVWEATELDQAYESEHVSVKIHGLEHFARFIEKSHHDIEHLVGEEIWKKDLSLTYTRLSLLHRKLGNELDAAEYMNKAISIFPSENNQKVHQQLLVDMVNQLDNNRFENKP